MSSARTVETHMEENPATRKRLIMQGLHYLTQYSTAGYEDRRYPVEVFDQIPLADRHHPGCLW